MREIKLKLILTLFVLGLFATGVMANPDPSGATLTEGASSRGTNPSVGQIGAQAGNVTQLNIDQTRLTEIWQGFYGNVSGRIVLENAGSATFYDWQSAAITGEVYATRGQVANWATINCTNSTYWDLEETALNIPTAATDGINETFNATAHPSFAVGAKTFGANVCPSTRPYTSGGLPGNYYNILLNSNATNVVYTSILADNSVGFDGSNVDFEILVPTDKLTGLSTYYFYVELN
jgi:hypothetical protein